MMDTKNTVKKSNSTIQLNLIAATVALLCGLSSSHAFGAWAGKIPTCNTFKDSDQTIPAYGIPFANQSSDPAATTMCTDFFGIGNFANSPLPAGTINDFTIINSGMGYVNPYVTIKDNTKPLGGCNVAATTDSLGRIIDLIPSGACNGYTIPQVTITDVGAGGSPGNATCGGVTLTACGSGAMATALITGTYTGGIKKFLDPLPDLKQQIATPDTAAFPGSDYYEIALVQFTQKMHSSLPPTTLRGYVQVTSGSSNAEACAGRIHWQTSTPHYLGPVILARRNVPVRVKFTNCLPTGTDGNLFVPDDLTYMGDSSAAVGGTFTENRGNIHLHGGATPWISDGTPHQWTVPVGESANPKKGESTANVPDMFFDGTGKVLKVGSVTGLQIPIPQCPAPTDSKNPANYCYPDQVTPASTIPTGYTNNPGDGALSYYFTNQQGGRLMFYHDHAYGVTRLNFMTGAAAAFLLSDPVQEDLLYAAGAPGTLGVSTPTDFPHLMPLVIQEKTFVPSKAQLLTQDPTWIDNFGATLPTSTNPMGSGDIWMPHVYMPNQNPSDPTLASGWGHWDYGPWFFPPLTTLTAGPDGATTIPCTSSSFQGQTVKCPITPNPSGTPESFGDTTLVNGNAYPTLTVAPAAYRLPILNATNDRSLNLSWFIADSTGTEVAMVQAAPPMTGSPLPLCKAINPVAVPALGIGLVGALLDANGYPINGTGLPAGCWPNYGPLPGIPASQTMWAADGRNGGVPDPTKAGPPWIQIATEGGLLPQPVIIPATPANYEGNTRSITITSVGVHGLWVGPAERAEVIVDFSKYSGQTLILYNDAPAPAPAYDTRLDYFTGNQDQTPIGGAPSTQPGYGPNTRTIMQVYVDPTLHQPNSIPFDLKSLNKAFTSTQTSKSIFAETQPTIIVPESTYNSTYFGTSPKDTYADISATSVTFTPYSSLQPMQLDAFNYASRSLDPSCFSAPPNPPATPHGSPSVAPPNQCVTLDQKTIQELFTLDYGRMNATLGTEIPLTNFNTQTTIPLGFVDPPTEIVKEGDTQLWKITHNGVDTHFVHFHLWNVQVVNRMGWDGSLRQVDANELGWKDTVRMNPLEDIVVALQPIRPSLPFPVPDSIRNLDVTGGPSTFSPADPFNQNITVTNHKINFGWEYVWHCHILGHEENDMMRPVIFEASPNAPEYLQVVTTQGSPNNRTLTWTDNSASETSFEIESSNDNFTTVLNHFVVDATSPSSSNFSTTGYGQQVTYTDTLAAGVNLWYRVRAVDTFTDSTTPLSPYPVPFKQEPVYSAYDTALANAPTVVGFTGAPTQAIYNTSFTVTASSSSTSIMPTITGTTGVCTVGPVTGTAANAVATVTMISGLAPPAGVDCTLTATWAYGTPVSKTQPTHPAPAAPVVSFTGAPVNATKGDTFLVSAVSSTGTAPIIGASGACSAGSFTGTSPASAVVTMTAASGNCLLSATWAATNNYLAGAATQTTVASLKDSVVLISGNPFSAVYDTSFTVTATTTATAVTPTIVGTPGICSVGSVTGTLVPLTNSITGTAKVTMLSGSGDCVLTANWAATTIYKAKSQVVHVKAVPNGTIVSLVGLQPQITNLYVPQNVTVKVAPNGTGYPFTPAAPTGSVTLQSRPDNSPGSSCTATLTAVAGTTYSTGACPLNFDTVGNRSFSMVYNGNTNYGSSTASQLSGVVNFTLSSLLPANGISQTTSTVAAGFSLTASPLLASGIAGKSTVLSATCNLPSGATGVICTPSYKVTGTSTNVGMTIKKGSASPGTYPITISVSYGVAGFASATQTSPPLSLVVK